MLSLLVATSLSIDCFAASVCIGMNKSRKMVQTGLKLAFVFAVFHFLMPGLGWLAGQEISIFFSNFDHWLVFFLLSFVGYRMIKNSYVKKGVDEPSNFNSLNLLLLSLATSIDAFIVGMSLAFLEVDILNFMIVISLTAFTLSLVGLFIGDRLSIFFRQRAEIVAGLVLIMIGLKTLIDHLIR